MAEPFAFTAWPDNDEGWEGWEAGVPSVMLFGNALQVWAWCQQRAVSVLEAAEAFRVPPALILEAVEEHPWMYVAGTSGDYARLTIEHEGD